MSAPLADLGFRLGLPGARLRPYVRHYWYMAGRPAAPRSEYMHPRGGFGLVFNLTGGAALHMDGQPLADPIFLDGSNSFSRQIALGGEIDLVGVRFYEGGAYPFLGLPLAELRDATALLAAVGGSTISRADLLTLHGRLLETSAVGARFALLEQWLHQRLTNGPARHPLIPASLALLRADAPPLTMPALADRLAIGQRQIERLYREQVGITPKQYARLLRVERARLALKLCRTSLTAIGLDLGYWDQAHFIRDFRNVVGLTPSAYAARQLRDTGR